MKFKLTAGNNKAIVAKIKSLDAKQDWIISIDPVCTHAQKKRYFKFLDSYSQHSGTHVLELHDHFKNMFLPKFVDLQLITEAGSITKESISSFMNFMEMCEAYAIKEGFEWQ
jgi:hypothetical protein